MCEVDIRFCANKCFCNFCAENISENRPVKFLL